MYLLNAKLPDSNLSYKASVQCDKQSNEMKYLRSHDLINLVLTYWLFTCALARVKTYVYVIIIRLLQSNIYKLLCYCRRYIQVI